MPDRCHTSSRAWRTWATIRKPGRCLTMERWRSAMAIQRLRASMPLFRCFRPDVSHKDRAVAERADGTSRSRLQRRIAAELAQQQGRLASWLRCHSFSNVARTRSELDRAKCEPDDKSAVERGTAGRASPGRPCCRQQQQSERASALSRQPERQDSPISASCAGSSPCPSTGARCGSRRACRGGHPARVQPGVGSVGFTIDMRLGLSPLRVPLTSR